MVFVGDPNSSMQGFIVIKSPREWQHALTWFNASETEMKIKFFDGYVSASFFESLNDGHVIEYVAWRSPEDFQSAFKNPLFYDHVPIVEMLAGPDQGVDILLGSPVLLRHRAKDGAFLDAPAPLVAGSTSSYMLAVYEGGANASVEETIDGSVDNWLAERSDVQAYAILKTKDGHYLEYIEATAPGVSGPALPIFGSQLYSAPLTLQVVVPPPADPDLKMVPFRLQMPSVDAEAP